MPAPVLLYGGIVALGALLMATGKKRSLETDTLKALKTENPAKVNEQAGRFDALNDDVTGQLLRALADRMAAHADGATGMAPAHAVDPDDSGEPGVAEWTGTLLTSQFSDAQLIRWADAYDAQKLPGAAKLLRDKAAEDDTPKEAEEPELSAELQKQVSDLLEANDDPFAMETLATTLEGMGREDVGAELRKHAAAIRDQWKQDEAEAVANGENVEDVGIKVTPAGNVVPAPKPPVVSPANALPNTLPQSTLDNIASVLASGDAKKMQALADGLENIGAKEAAAQLRARAIEILAATPKAATPIASKPAVKATPKPAPIVVAPKLPAPAPAPVRPAPVVVAPAPVVVPATHVVKNGESPWGVAMFYTGDGSKSRELVKANPQYAPDASGAGFKNFYAGMTLKLPAAWQVPPASAGARYELAQKVSASPSNVALVKQFQMQEGTVRVGSADGKYGPKSALAVASYGIIPAKPLVWSTATKAADMAKYKAIMNDYAQKDAPRAAQWIAAGKV